MLKNYNGCLLDITRVIAITKKEDKLLFFTTTYTLTVKYGYPDYTPTIFKFKTSEERDKTFNEIAKELEIK